MLTLIVSVALNNAFLPGSRTLVAVVAEDMNILVLLLYHRNRYMNDVLFLTESKRHRGGKTIVGKCISIKNWQNKIGFDACTRILAVHTFGGCDTTSAIYGLGKR